MEVIVSQRDTGFSGKQPVISDLEQNNDTQVWSPLKLFLLRFPFRLFVKI